MKSAIVSIPFLAVGRLQSTQKTRKHYMLFMSTFDIKFVSTKLAIRWKCNDPFKTVRAAVSLQLHHALSVAHECTHCERREEQVSAEAGYRQGARVLERVEERGNEVVDGSLGQLEVGV